jgi:tetratricopeptide (TPR) repeat protein
MKQKQALVLIFAVALFVVFYFLMPTSPTEKKGTPDKTAQPINDQSLLLEARKSLDSLQLLKLDSLEQQKGQATTVSQEIEVYKAFSKQWNSWGNFAVGGFYAEKIAELQPSGEAWSITGTTFGEAFNQNQDLLFRQYVARKAIHAFEQATLLEKDTVAHQINEALMYIDLSGVDNTVPPMTGAQKLIALDKAFPNNVRINFTLAQLSMTRSRDFTKAIGRLEKLVAIPNLDTLNLLDANYMLLSCYQELGDKEKALLYFDKCIALAKFDPELQAKIIQGKQEYDKSGK